jgi:hypothetical protein
MHQFEMESKSADINDGIVPRAPSSREDVGNLVGDVEGNITDGAGRRGDGGEGKWEKQQDLEILLKIARLKANADRLT